MKRDGRECYCCAARESDGADLGRFIPFPYDGPSYTICTDCFEERAAALLARHGTPAPARPAITRARYRAALRKWDRVGQTDLVDALGGRP